MLACVDRPHTGNFKYAISFAQFKFKFKFKKIHGVLILICQDDPEDASARRHAVIDNPAVADWFFYERVSVTMLAL